MDNNQNKPQIMKRFFIPAKRFGLTLIFLAASAWISLPVFAGEYPALRPIDFETTALNLSAVQQQKLTTLESASHTQSGQFIQQIQQIRQKLSDCYAAYGLDVAEARRLNQDLNRVQGLLLDLRLSEQLQLRQILTPDQFSQLQAAMNKHHIPNGDHHDEPKNEHGPPYRHLLGNQHWGFHPG